MAQELHVFTEAPTPDETLTDALKGIKVYLDERAQTDSVFAIKYLTSGKTLIGAVRYLAHKNLDNVVLKGEPADRGKFDFAMSNNDADNELAAQYFMDDSLDYEKAAEPKAKAPKEPKPKKEKKNHNTTTSKPQSNVKPSTPVITPTAATPSVAADEEVIDLFAGLFD